MGEHSSRQDLDRYVSFKAVIARAIYHPHPTRSNLFNNEIVPEALANHIVESVVTIHLRQGTQSSQRADTASHARHSGAQPSFPFLTVLVGRARATLPLEHISRSS